MKTKLILNVVLLSCLLASCTNNNNESEIRCLYLKAASNEGVIMDGTYSKTEMMVYKYVNDNGDFFYANKEFSISVYNEELDVFQNEYVVDVYETKESTTTVLYHGVREMIGSLVVEENYYVDVDKKQITRVTSYYNHISTVFSETKQEMVKKVFEEIKENGMIICDSTSDPVYLDSISRAMEIYEVPMLYAGTVVTYVEMGTKETKTLTI